MLIAGNWKMYKGPDEARQFCAVLAPRVAPLASRVDMVVCPPFVSLHAALDGLGDSHVRVFAQNAHWEAEGAYTGEVSPVWLRSVGAAGTIVGHSERRQHFGETDETVALRVRTALGAGLDVIACVGETEDERERGATEDVLRAQLAVLEPHARLILPYEPVWAIGTEKTATPDLAQDAHAFIKSLIEAPVLYGGSVKPENAEELLAQPDVDGALVGGASLDADSFVAICEAAARVTA